MKKTLTILLLSFLAFLSPIESKAEKPNIIFVMADDVSPQYYKTYNSTKSNNNSNGPSIGVASPNLDYMASKGIKFNKAYAASICAASRAILFTGKFGRDTRCYHNAFNSFQGNDTNVNNHLTMARMFKESGYKTGYFGKWGVSGELENYDYKVVWETGYRGAGVETSQNDGSVGARYWHPAISINGSIIDTSPSDYGPDVFVDQILYFMEENKGVPYTVHYGMVDPHAERGHDWPTTPSDLSRSGVRLKKPDTPKKRYRNIIAYGDKLLGQIIQKAESQNRPFIIVFCGDNATATEGKQEATVRGCHVPFVVYGDGVVNRGGTSRLLSFADLLPTFADYAGYANPIFCDGISLKPFWDGSLNITRQMIYSNISSSNIYVCGNYKIENRDFIRGNAMGDFRKSGRRIDKNRVYRKMIRYGQSVNGSPLKEGSGIMRSQKAKAHIKYWIKLGER